MAGRERESREELATHDLHRHDASSSVQLPPGTHAGPDGAAGTRSPSKGAP